MLKSIISKLMKLYYTRIKHMDGSDITIMKLRKRGVKIGEGCRVFTSISINEPTLLSLGDRVTISSDVSFCTHDNAVIKAIPGKTDVVGKIEIGDDCFVGMKSIIMYGVSLGDHCVVAAGSVVTKSFPPHTVLGGNPARAISTIDDYAEKYKDFAIDFRSIPMDHRPQYFREHSELLVKR